MIQSEVSILRRVKHPNIVLLIEEMDTISELYLVMELVKVPKKLFLLLKNKFQAEIQQRGILFVLFSPRIILCMHLQQQLLLKLSHFPDSLPSGRRSLWCYHLLQQIHRARRQLYAVQSGKRHQVPAQPQHRPQRHKTRKPVGMFGTTNGLWAAFHNTPNLLSQHSTVDDNKPRKHAQMHFWKRK